jgi:hypothetical protein
VTVGTVTPVKSIMTELEELEDDEANEAARGPWAVCEQAAVIIIIPHIATQY